MHINAGGNFWTALDDGRLAGTIGIMPCGDDTAVLKKFFVYEKYQDELPIKFSHPYKNCDFFMLNL